VADASPPPIITFLTRPGCHLCDDARAEIAAVMSERESSGRPAPRVVELNIDADPVLHARHFETIPVIQCGSDELPLAVRPGAIRRFLARVLDGVPA
jgi:Glutaredoxin-like domain (DUF836)